jgi:hypothetical protein
MTDKTYNGWSNYETWLVALWFDNDQGTQEYCVEMAQDCAGNRKPNPFAADGYTSASYTLGERLKDYAEEICGLEDASGLAADLIGAALAEVNWREIAEHYLADLPESDESDD